MFVNYLLQMYTDVRLYPHAEQRGRRTSRDVNKLSGVVGEIFLVVFFEAMK